MIAWLPSESRASFLARYNDEVLEEALALLPAKMDSVRARVLMLAIGLQESRFEHRRQIRGPAKSHFQFELGGVRGVLTHEATKVHAMRICRRRGVPVGVPGWMGAAHRALEKDDILAACFARLNLWWDPAPLPAVDDAAASWALYLRTWRPGKPHPQTWAALHADAAAVFKAAT